MRHKFCVKGKKAGIIGSAISNFWSYIVFVLIVIVFFFFFKLQAIGVKENKIVSFESEINLDMAALNYLRTPVDIEGIFATDDITFADFIIQSIREPLLQDDRLNFFEETDEIIDKYIHIIRDPELGQRLMILTDGNTKCWYDSWGTCLYDQPLRPRLPKDSGVLLPNPGFDYHIEVSMDYN